jgi:hypothetical protein
MASDMNLTNEESSPMLFLCDAGSPRGVSRPLRALDWLDRPGRLFLLYENVAQLWRGSLQCERCEDGLGECGGRAWLRGEDGGCVGGGRCDRSAAIAGGGAVIAGGGGLSRGCG